MSYASSDFLLFFRSDVLFFLFFCTVSPLRSLVFLSCYQCLMANDKQIAEVGQEPLEGAARPALVSERHRPL